MGFTFPGAWAWDAVEVGSGFGDVEVQVGGGVSFDLGSVLGGEARPGPLPALWRGAAVSLIRVSERHCGLDSEPTGAGDVFRFGTLPITPFLSTLNQTARHLPFRSIGRLPGGSYVLGAVSPGR